MPILRRRVERRAVASRAPLHLRPAGKSAKRWRTMHGCVTWEDERQEIQWKPNVFLMACLTMASVCPLFNIAEKLCSTRCPIRPNCATVWVSGNDFDQALHLQYSFPHSQFGQEMIAECQSSAISPPKVPECIFEVRGPSLKYYSWRYMCALYM